MLDRADWIAPRVEQLPGVDAAQLLAGIVDLDEVVAEHRRELLAPPPLPAAHLLR